MAVSRALSGQCVLEIEFRALMVETGWMIRARYLTLLGGLSLVISCSGGDTTPDAGETIPDASVAPDADFTSCVGKPDGTVCGDRSNSACDLPDYCLSGFCFANFTPLGTPCGDETDTTCNGRDTCDGSGTCQTNLALAGTNCGDAAEDECTASDSCDGQGTCQGNHMADGTVCGATDDTMCTNPDACVSGVCVANHEFDGAICEDCVLGPGQCAGCQAGACLNVCGGPFGLQTALDGSDGVRHHVMFDIRAIQDIQITSIDGVFDPGLHAVDVYYVAGGYAGSETNSSNWTKIGDSVNVLYNNRELPTPIPKVIDVVIPAGETYGFLVSTQNTDQVVTSSVSEGEVFTSDENMEIIVGVGSTILFSSSHFARMFNGRVNYLTNPPCASPM